jgi:hypothetical protein
MLPEMSRVRDKLGDLGVDRWKIFEEDITHIYEDVDCGGVS